MPSVYTVSQVNSYISNMFSQDYMLRKIQVSGEVSNCKYHSLGHIYFTLKDSGGTLSAVMFRSQTRGLSFVMQEGQQVVVTGSIEVYQKAGSYQIYASKIEKQGQGNLYEKYIKLKNELDEMGLFAEDYKQPIPKLAGSIGIVTARTGAALQDIISVSTRRNPYVQLVLYPAIVQGEDAASSIVNGIKALDSYGVDTIIVGRGGGSIEDLWAFNEEKVARAIFEAHTPIICAVGHETDYTIADFVADLRAPTPSAAAELATIDMRDFLNNLNSYKDRFRDGIQCKIDALRSEVHNMSVRMMIKSPSARLRSANAQGEELRLRMKHAIHTKMDNRTHRLALLSQKLETLTPLKRISQGYAYVTDEEDTRIKKAKDLKVGDRVTLRFADGKADADIKEVYDGKGTDK